MSNAASARPGAVEDATSVGDVNPQKDVDGDEANESNNGTVLGSMADDAKETETETDVVEELVAAATDDKTAEAAPNAEKR